MNRASICFQNEKSHNLIQMNMSIAYTWRRLTLSVVLLILAMYVQAQGTSRTVTFPKFALQEAALEGDFSGLRMQFDIGFNWVEEDFFKRSFTVSYRMVQGDRVVLASGDGHLNNLSISPTVQTIKGKSVMTATGYSIFIPYIDIPLEAGPQTAEVIFSLANDEGTYTDCFKKTVSFTHKKIVRHDLNQQVFTWSDLQCKYGLQSFSGNYPGMQMSAKVQLKYGPQESLNSEYEFALLLRNTAGKVVFDSRKAAKGSDPTRTLKNEMVDGKPSGVWSSFVGYYDIAMEGPGEAEVVLLLLGAEGGPKEIYQQKMMLQLPPQYNYETQEFALKAVSATEAVRDGVKGIAVAYNCGFKKAGIIRNPEKGQYYFYAAIFDANNKLVVAPDRSPTSGAGTSHLLDGHLPGEANVPAEGTLFIPLHLLNLPAGTHNLRFALMVSDINLQAKFPMVGNGNIVVNKPADVKYRVSLESLEMIDSDYDVEVIPVSSRLPELQYFFAVGKDRYFTSDYTKNSLTALPGAVTLHLSEGDPIQMVLYDVDSGFFNESDALGTWKIEYAGKGDSFDYVVNNSGQVVHLKLKITRQ